MEVIKIECILIWSTSYSKYWRWIMVTECRNSLWSMQVVLIEIGTVLKIREFSFLLIRRCLLVMSKNRIIGLVRRIRIGGVVAIMIILYRHWMKTMTIIQYKQVPNKSSTTWNKYSNSDSKYKTMQKPTITTIIEIPLIYKAV